MQRASENLGVLGEFVSYVTSRMTINRANPPPESVVTLTFELVDSSVPVRAVTEMADCRFRLEETVPRGDGRYATYYSVDGGDADRILELASEHETCEAKFLDHRAADGVLKMTVTDDRPLLVLAAQGAIPGRLIVENGTKVITVEVSPEYDANEIISRFKMRYPDAELTARKQRPHAVPVFTDRGLEAALEDRLTDRQRDALYAAHEEGFYEWPRATTGEQLAETLGIAAPTFHQHLRNAEQNLVQLIVNSRNSRSDEER